MNMMNERAPLANATPNEAMAILFAAPMLHGAQAMMQVHSAVIAGTQSLMEDWMRRRHEAVTDGRRLIERLWGCRDAAGIWDAQGEWLQGTTRRLSADARGPLDASVLCLAGATTAWKAGGNRRAEAA